MESEKKPVVSLNLQKGLPMGESMNASLVFFPEDMKEENKKVLMERVNFVFGLFDERIVYNNKIVLEANKKLEEEEALNRKA